MESPRAGFSVRVHTIPKPITNCMRAKDVLVSTGWWSTIEAFQVIVWATQLGLPLAARRSIPLKPSDPCVNMMGWICSTASKSHTVARASWNVRWRSLGGRPGPRSHPPAARAIVIVT